LPTILIQETSESATIRSQVVLRVLHGLLSVLDSLKGCCFDPMRRMRMDRMRLIGLLIVATLPIACGRTDFVGAAPAPWKNPTVIAEVESRDAARDLASANEQDSAPQSSQTDAANKADPVKVDAVSRADTAITADTLSREDAATKADAMSREDALIKADVVKADTATARDTAVPVCSDPSTCVPTTLCPDGGALPSRIVIGGFDVSRGVDCNIVDGSFLRRFRERLSASRYPGVTFVFSGTATITSAYLSTIDLLFLLSTASNVSAIAPLSRAEQDAVSAYIQKGGRFLISSDNSSFGGTTTEDANNSILAPVHMTAGGQSYNGKHTIEAVDVVSPLLTGRSGRWSVVDANYPGTWKDTGVARVIAYVDGNRSMPALAQFNDGDLGPGAGRGVVLADMNAMVDYAGANVVMLDNILDYLMPTCR
jgi:hypothetical protein